MLPIAHSGAKALAALCLFSWVPGPGDAAEHPSLDSAQIADIDACVLDALEDQGAPGGAVALALDGEIVFERAYGTKNLNTGEPVTLDTLFRPGSVQKMMTSASVLLQVQEGRLSLDDSVQALIPDFELAGPWSTAEITVRDLLTHTSGIPDMSDPVCSQSLSDWAADLGNIPHFAPAGTFYNYTNAGYSLAGLVAERADGRPYAQLMTEAVWRPAGMESTFQSPADAIAYGDVSWGHELDESTGELVAFPPDTFECPWAGPAGDFFTTASDLLRFPLALMANGGSVMSPDTAELLVSPAVPTLHDPAESYALGIVAREVAGQRVLYHSGGVPGGSSHVMWLPDASWGLSVVANRALDLSGAARCVLESSQGLVWPEPAEPKPPHTWRKFQGVYIIQVADGDTLPMAFWFRGRRLMVTAISPFTGELTTWTAVPTGPDAFWIDLDLDGEPNGLERISFVPTQGPFGVWTWLRNRLYVGLNIAPIFAPNENRAGQALRRFME